MGKDVRGPLVFCAVQPGFEEALEEDVLHRFPGAEARLAFRGFRAFELPGSVGLPELEPPLSHFARSWGLWLGEEERPWESPRFAPFFTKPFFLQCWSRREFMPGAREKRPVLIDVEIRERALCEEFLKAGLPLEPEALPRSPGDRVLSAIRLKPDLWAWGAHLHAEGRLPFPGGEFPWPEHDIPSRAYLKCREALAITGTRPRAGESALELGCSPGGALLALLEQGLDVVGVDPAPLDPAVLEAARAGGRKLAHLRARAELLDVKDFPERVDWLFSDMNVAPEELLRWMDLWRPELRSRGLRAAFLTLKLTDRAFVHGLREVMEGKRREWGASRALLRQLSQNRREILFYVSFID